MQNKALFITLSLLIAGMVAWLGYQYVDAMEVAFEDELVKQNQQDSNKSIKAFDDGWVDKFAKANKAEYTYPATELQIKLDLISKMSDEKLYRVVIDQIDSYKFFCLNQVLKSNNIKFSYYKTKGFVKLVITTDDKKYMLGVLEQLKDYGITYKVEETIKRG